MLGAYDGELVLVGGVAGVREGQSHPVGGANESCFGVQVVGSLLLACAEGGFVKSCGAGDAVCGEVWG